MHDEIRNKLNEINEHIVGETMRATGAAALQAKSDVSALVKMAHIASRKKDSDTRKLLMRAARTVRHQDEFSAEFAYNEGVVELVERTVLQINALGAHAKNVVEHRDKILREA